MAYFYQRPLIVYILLASLGVWGIVSAFNLSISLFPMSSQPTVSVNISYGSYSSEQFYETIGKKIESGIQPLKSDGVAISNLEARYNDGSVQYKVQFGWGADPDEALRNIENKVKALVSPYESGIRDSVGVWAWRQNQGFFAVSFYSPMRTLDEIHEILNPLIIPMNADVEDAAEIGLYNPNQKEFSIVLKPEKLALFEISPRQIENSIRDAIFGLSGGSIKIGEKDYRIRLEKRAASIEELEGIRVSAPTKKAVLLRDVADLKLNISENSSQKFRTSGVESLILFASPKEGGNIKRMSDQVRESLEILRPQWPQDIQYKILVNPSEFIDRSIQSVIKEVGLAAFLAVLVLLVFIGNLKNVATAAIEIPLSLVMAFILMRITGMNLNLISLGGLALSAGMNVDASVVVLENIFRKFEENKKELNYEEKLSLILQAVSEVRLPVIAATIASLVVFMPLIYTKGLTNSLLGDLAKAVIFSHGLSAFVALLLVPTIRLHIIKNGSMKVYPSPFESLIRAVENFYERLLSALLQKNTYQFVFLFTLFLSLPLLIYFKLPSLPKEVIGKPDTDWIVVGLNSPTISTPKEWDSEILQLDEKVRASFSDDIQYTFAQVGSWGGNTMLKVKKASEGEALQKKLENIFTNTATKFYYVVPWNPSELRIPNPPDFEIDIIGGTIFSRQRVSSDLQQILKEQETFDYVSVTPSAEREKEIVFVSRPLLTEKPELLSRSDLSHYLRVATSGISVEQISNKGIDLPIYLKMPKEYSSRLEYLKALPVGAGGKIIPIGALADISFQNKKPGIFRENLQELSSLTGSMKLENKKKAKDKTKVAEDLVQSYRQKLNSIEDPPSIVNKVPDVELQSALDQLKIAILISIGLVFLTMVFQLGDIVHALLVLLAIPLGALGVILSIWLFNSTISLNSGLGMILLNGISVANSIILVDFIRRKFQESGDPFASTVGAAKVRLRPILMTSFTTILGMLPIALGLGEGGKTLQPLGIAVSGGLWVSTMLTLFLVPSLQYQYLKIKKRRETHV
ncbi:MAG: efflux RND transporter permease subunit [Oligoflexia bacterium]|nr:efflux RND transporter permease subunit [Oligoflexia bacterium]